jgi:hypothetical protein
MSSTLAPRLAILSLICLMLMPSCAAVFQGSKTNLTVSTQTPGSVIKHKGEIVGKDGKATVKVNRNTDQQFEVSAPGYETKTVNFTKSVQGGFVVADILLAGLVGVIVDAATGAWHKFDGDKIPSSPIQKPGFEKKVVLEPAK